MKLIHLGPPGGINVGQLPNALSTGGGGRTVLHREANGTVTVVSLAKPPKLTLTRQPNGTATVSG